MNTENIDLVAQEIHNNLRSGNYRSAEELINVYRNLYSFYNKTELIESHLQDFIRLKNKINNVLIKRELVAGNVKAVKTLTNIIRNIDSLIADGKRATKNNNTYKGKQLLDVSKDHNILIALFDNEKNRGIGKSLELLKSAYQLDCTLVTNDHFHKKYHEEMARTLNIPVDIRYVKTPNDARGLRFKNNKFLVDEMVTVDVIMQLLHDDKELVGGFLNLCATHAAKKKDDTVADYLQEKLIKVENEMWVLQRTFLEKVNEREDYKHLTQKSQFIKELLKDLK